MDLTFQEQKERQNVFAEIQTFSRPEYVFHSNFERKIFCSDKTTKRGRTYVTPEGNRYPSITTVLSKSKSEKAKQTLENWRKRLGPAKADKETRRAANRGSSLHSLVENYIKAVGESEHTIEGGKQTRLFRQIHPLLQRIGEVHMIEQPLYSDVLNVAGRVDLIAEFDGKLSVIDIKSSTKEKREDWIQDYLLQETFYSVAFGALFEQKIEQIVTIMAVENSEHPQIWIRKPGDFLKPLILRVRKYYLDQLEENAD